MPPSTTARPRQPGQRHGADAGPEHPIIAARRPAPRGSGEDVRSPGRAMKRISMSDLAAVGNNTWGLVILALGLLFLALLIPTFFSSAPAPLTVLFGWGAYAVVPILLVGGSAVLLARSRRWVVRWWAALWGESLFISLLGLLHSVPDASLEGALAGQHGGLVGWAISRLLMSMLGPVGTLVLLAGLCLLWFGLLLRALPASWLQRTVHALAGLLRSMQPAPAAEPLDEDPYGVPYGALDEALSAAPHPRPARAEAGTANQAAGPRSGRRKKRANNLPPLDILTADAHSQSSSTDSRHRAQLLKQTLSDFGVPVEVVSIKEGPVVTQFGLEPGEIVRQMGDGQVQRRKISVSRIMRLSNDLALALAAPTVRIEAPVPGRPYVGIEIPNTQKSLVSIRGVLESRTMGRASSPLTAALGRDVSGEPVAVDLARLPHLLIAGATGSGKSVCINALVCSLLMNNGPETLRLLMIDPKMVELPAYNGIPHLVAPVVVDTSQATAALAWLTVQMDDRYRLFASHGVRNIEEFNRITAKNRSAEVLPFLVLVVDELADLMMTAADDVERLICRLAQMSRATGIHLVLATQRPSVDVITGLIKANFPARVAFAVSSQIDSRVILDSPGAEKLLGRGDMLFMSPEAAGPVRVQGCFVSDGDIERLVDFWSDGQGEDGQSQSLPPWAGLLARADEQDDLMSKAVALVQDRKNVSTSLLQRLLRVGFPRAARLMDQLEDMGLVGPDEGAGRSRRVLRRPSTGNDEDDSAGEEAWSP